MHINNYRFKIRISVSQEEHDRVMEEMAGFEQFAAEPEVGIFWFLPEKECLFDVRSMPISTIPNGLRTIPVLHKNIWAKNYHRAKAHGDKESIYFTDYTQIPRGRVWYYRSEGVFKVTVGHWIEQYRDVLVPLIKDEFSLPDFTFDIDEHWDLGHGWSEHDFLVTAKD